MSGPLTDVVEGIVHEPTQTDGRGLDLTLEAVYEVTEPGRVDFGGGELQAAEREPISTTLRHSDDEYGWYHLDTGGYLVAFNEQLSDQATGAYWLQTRDALRTAGAFHPTLRVEELTPVPLTVSGEGIRLKENARVSTLFEP
jgi:hypothetical protein